MTTQEDDHGYAYDHAVTAVKEKKNTTSLWSQLKRKVRRIKRRLATASIFIRRQSERKFESFLFPGLSYGILQVVSNHEFKRCVVGSSLSQYLFTPRC